MNSKWILWFCIVLLIFCISCSDKGIKTFTARKASETLSLASEERVFAVDVFLLLDQSGSMNGSPGHSATDPQGLRVNASEYLIRNIASNSDESSPNRIGIVNFGSTAPAHLTIPLTKVTKAANDEGVGNLKSSLKVLSLGDTSFISALKSAYNGFESFDTFTQRRKPIIIIFTDGEPDDERKLSQEEYFKEIGNFISTSLQPNGCDIYIIGIDAAGTNWVSSDPNWKKILSDRFVYQISNMQQLREQFNEAIRQIFGIPPVPPEVVTPKGLEFDIPPYLEKVEFHVFPEQKGLTLAIFGPDGVAIAESSPKVSVSKHETYDIITVFEPVYGKWKYQVVGGEGKIEVYRNAVPVNMKLISPREIHPLAKPMKLVASFVKMDGNEVVEIPEYPIGLTAKVISPDGSESNIRFNRGEKGICFGTPSFDNTKTEGVYRIVLTMKGGDVYKSSQERIIQVKSIPYVVVDKPLTDSSLSFRQSLQVEARLLHDGKPIKPEDEFFDHPGALVLAQVVQTPGGGKSEAIWLDTVPDSQSPGQFYGLLPVELKQEGQCVLVVKLSGQLRSGENLAGDYSEVKFLAQPNMWQRISRTSAWIFYIVAIIIFLALSIWLIWLISLPVMQGHLYIYQSTGETNVPLAQQRLERRKFRFFKVKKTADLPARRLWVNRVRKDRTKIMVRYWEGLLLKSRRVSQNESVTMGRKHTVKYM
jgi:uncharacterized protein YegL